jgi:hypothetical protein
LVDNSLTNCCGGNNIILLTKVDERPLREWYARAAIGDGWSGAVLTNQIMSQLHRRAGTAPTNYAASLPAADSDPYTLKFPTLAGRRRRTRLERAIVLHIQEFLLEGPILVEPTGRRLYCHAVGRAGRRSCGAGGDRRLSRARHS